MMTPRSVFEKLVSIAITKGYMIGNPHATAIRKAIERGEEIPDRLLPGRIVMSLSDEEREILRDLDASKTNDRQK